MQKDEFSLLKNKGSNQNSLEANDSEGADSVVDSNLASSDIEQMLGLLTHPDTEKRTLAARVFCEIQEPRAIPYLINLLNDKSPMVRASSAYALGRNPSSEAIAPLISLLYEDSDGDVRKGVVWALGNSSDSRAVQPLITALKTETSSVRLWAASCLAQVAVLSYEDIIAAIPPLIGGLRRDEMATVRSNCAWAIGKLCRELPSNVVYATAIDSLIESMVEDSDFGVKDDAKLAILKVGDPRGLRTIEELELEGLV